MFGRKKKNPRNKRLEMEHQSLKELCNNSSLIDYEIVQKRKGLPPDKYLVHYKVKSIIKIEENGAPIYGENHTAQISLPSGYPMTSAPICFMKTDTWHPNIRSAGEAKGHICINEYVLGAWHTLDMLVIQIGEMLQYKNYHALQTIQPYPEDLTVAKWVREYAEPRGIVNIEKGIVVDDRLLLKPSQEWLDSRSKKDKIKIGKITKF